MGGKRGEGGEGGWAYALEDAQGVVARGLQLRRHLTSRDSGALLQHADEQQEACISYVNGIAHAKGQLGDGVDGGGAISGCNCSERVQGVTGERLIRELRDKEGQPDAAFSCTHQVGGKTIDHLGEQEERAAAGAVVSAEDVSGALAHQRLLLDDENHT